MWYVVCGKGGCLLVCGGWCAGVEMNWEEENVTFKGRGDSKVWGGNGAEVNRRVPRSGQLRMRRC